MGGEIVIYLQRTFVKRGIVWCEIRSHPFGSVLELARADWHQTFWHPHTAGYRKLLVFPLSVVQKIHYGLFTCFVRTHRSESETVVSPTYLAVQCGGPAAEV